MADGQDNGASGAGADAGAAGGAAAAPAPVTAIPIADLKAGGIADSYFDDKGNLNVKGIAEQLGDYTRLKSAADERAKLIPADGAYSFDLPKDFKGPEGMEWKPDAVFTKELATAFKEAGITQAEVNRLIPVYAANELRKVQAAQAAAQETFKAELTKLGPDAPKRLETVGKAAIGVFGETLGKALINSDAMANADTVIALEKFINENGARLAVNSAAGAGGNNNRELAEHVGKPGGGRKLMEAANAVKK